MLANQYVYSYEFGFKTNEKRLLTWHYTVGADGGLHSDADAGAIYAIVSTPSIPRSVDGPLPSLGSPVRTMKPARSCYGVLSTG